MKYNRKYYLHRQVKKFARLIAKRRTIYLSFAFSPSKMQQKYLSELSNTYGYAVQTEIPT